MAVLPIYLIGSEVLRKVAKPVQTLDNSLIKLVYDMTETMQRAHGIGLAANQVGELRRVIVIDLSAVERAETEEEGEEDEEPQPFGERKTMVLINPEVLEPAGSVEMEEGCLSIPDVRADVARPETIHVKFLDVNMKEVVQEAQGLLARVILHEFDHLNGVLFLDHLTKTKRALLKPAVRKIQKGEVDTSYPVISAVEV
ncbi:MAG: peptide deformylase [Ignavibacteriales bacterium]|nr:peptide deformylase [Ignavibacteriales bacterium]